MGSIRTLGPGTLRLSKTAQTNSNPNRANRRICKKPDRHPVFTPSPSFAPQHDILVIEAEPAAAAHVAALRREYRVVTTANRAVAIQYLNKRPPALVIADLDVDSDAGIDVCRAAKSVRTPATVLITTSEAVSVPDLLIAGCDKQVWIGKRRE